MIGWIIFILFVCSLCAMWGLHMWAVLKDIAKEDAEELADELFDEYVRGCEYKVHTTVRIVNEMKGGKRDA